MKTNSIKIITLAAKKIMLQKKILKYQEMIKDHGRPPAQENDRDKKQL